MPIQQRKRSFSTKVIFLGFIALIASCFSACSEDDTIPLINSIPHTSSIDTIPPYFQNNPLPRSKGSLKVLAIGNSYTEDDAAYISEITEGCNIDPSTYCLYTLTKGSTSLQYWSDMLDSGDTVIIYRNGGGKIIMPKRKHPMAEILAQDWDVIVLQQYSSLAYNISSYNPYLRHLIDEVRRLCTNPQVTFAWQLIPAYGKDSPNNKGLAGNERWERIVDATLCMQQYDGINVIIPTGTAIQIARQSELETASDLTRDNTHLCYGIGRYIAAATWVQTLFAPVYDCNITNCRATHPLTAKERTESYDGFIEASSVEVTEQNRPLCLQCAIEACKHPFSLR